MKKSQIDDLVELRTHASAVVLLTGRDDLEVMECSRASGIDLLVSIRKDNHPTLRQFGLILFGHIKSFQSLKDVNRAVKSMLAKRARISSDVMPICVFSFAMTGSSGFFAWMFEPIIGGQGPKLRRNDELKPLKLDKEALADIVRTVDEYYDALNSVVCEF
jgi:nitrate reductase NapE component